MLRRMSIPKKIAALGAFFVVAIAIAACGSSVPSDSVAAMAGNPITTKAFNHWMYIAAKQEALEEEEEEGESSPVIVPNDPPKFDNCLKQIRTLIPELASTKDSTLRSECNEVFQEYKTEVMNFLIEGYWYQAQAYKQGIKLTDAELQKQLAKDEKQQFPTDTSTELKSYLTETGETMADLKFQIRVSYLYEQLVKKATKKVTPAQIEAYYKSHMSTFGTKASADVHLLQTKTEAEAQAAYNALKGGASWDTVASQYSATASGKKNGGLLTDVTDGEEEAAVNTAIFKKGATGQLQGPIKGNLGDYYVIQVTKVTPATQQSLKEATKTIKEILSSQASTAAEKQVAKTMKDNWKGRTICRALYSVANCSNYVKPKTTTTATSTTPATSTTTSTASTGGSGVTSTSTTGTSTTK
jgi:foldase protein PrsA